MNIKEKIKAYDAILEVVESYADIIEGDSVVPSVCSLTQTLENLKVSDRFDIPLQDLRDAYVGWLKVGKRYDDFMILGLFGEKHNRTISWSDDGSQPEDEWLFKIGFSTGAYIFGESYPTNTFKEFWDELKSYGPAYCDTANHCLYFKDAVAKVVYDNFYLIFDKYKAKVADEVKEQRRLKLLEELAKLGDGK